MTEDQNIERRPANGEIEHKGVVSEVVIPAAVGLGVNAVTPVLKDAAGKVADKVKGDDKK
jgi:hypothetical protein